MSKLAKPFKTGCLGCLGFLVLLVVFLGISAIVVKSRSGDERIADQTYSSATAENPDLALLPAGAGASQKPAAGQGLVVLELGQGDFQLHRGEPGTGVVVKAHYDENIYQIEKFSHVWPDSSWVYQIRSHRTVSGLHAMLAELMGGAEPARLHIYIPPDRPLALDVLVTEGGLEADVGGLWLTDLGLRYKKGGVELNIGEPLVEPLEILTVHGRMGGGAISNLGNASPRALTVSCAMGGMSLDLGGDWTRDCDANLSLHMGGMTVMVPDNIELEDPEAAGTGLRRTDAEVDRPVLRVRKTVKMGEIEFQ